jgi:hypothetical protein
MTAYRTVTVNGIDIFYGEAGSPDSRTNRLVRKGGLCNISHDFNRRLSLGSNLGSIN